MHVTHRGAVVGRVGGGAAGFVTGEPEEVAEADVPLREGVVLLGGDARRVALSSMHHLESKVGVYRRKESANQNRGGEGRGRGHDRDTPPSQLR